MDSNFDCSYYETPIPTVDISIIRKLWPSFIISRCFNVFMRLCCAFDTHYVSPKCDYSSFRYIFFGFRALKQRTKYKISDNKGSYVFACHIIASVPVEYRAFRRMIMILLNCQIPPPPPPQMDAPQKLCKPFRVSFLLFSVRKLNWHS